MWMLNTQTNLFITNIPRNSHEKSKEFTNIQQNLQEPTTYYEKDAFDIHHVQNARLQEFSIQKTHS